MQLRFFFLDSVISGTTIESVWVYFCLFGPRCNRFSWVWCSRDSKVRSEIHRWTIPVDGAGDGECAEKNSMSVYVLIEAKWPFGFHCSYMNSVVITKAPKAPYSWDHCLSTYRPAVYSFIWMPGWLDGWFLRMRKVWMKEDLLEDQYQRTSEVNRRFLTRHIKTWPVKDNGTHSFSVQAGNVCWAT